MPCAAQCRAKEMIQLMKNKWLLLLAAAVLMVGALAAVGCSSDADTDGADAGGDAEAPAKYIVATDAPYGIFEFLDDAGNHDGFDIDLLKAIAANQGFEVEFKTYNFDAMLAGLAGEPDDFDFAISAITITDERAEQILFSKPYFMSAGQTLSVPKDSAIKSIDDLEPGMKVAIQTGTTGYFWAEENLEPNGIVLMGYPQGIDCFSAMRAGDVDAALVDADPAAEYVAQEAMNAMIVQTIDTDEKYGIAFPKSATEIHAKVDAGLAAIVADGTYAEIYKKWFGVEPSELP